MTNEEFFLTLCENNYLYLLKDKTETVLGINIYYFTYKNGESSRISFTQLGDYIGTRYTGDKKL